MTLEYRPENMAKLVESATFRGLLLQPPTYAHLLIIKAFSILFHVSSSSNIYKYSNNSFWI